MKMLRTTLLCLACVLCAALPAARAALAAAPAVSKNALHFAQDMEFYYLRPRPEVLPGILRSFDAQGVLAQGDKRLAAAAFLAEVLRRDPDARQRLFPPAPSLSRDAARTLAWTAHLAGLPDAEALKNALLMDESSPVLRRQIDAAPTRLKDWDINTEKTVLQMYWAAYLASGDNAYLNPVIDAALEYARLNAAGLRRDPGFAPGAAAAASLYEFAPRHEAVQRRLEAVLQGLRDSGPEAQTLRLILRR